MTAAGVTVVVEMGGVGTTRLCWVPLMSKVYVTCWPNIRAGDAAARPKRVIEKSMMCMYGMDVERDCKL